MRPLKEHQNRLVHPLNEIFGTEANVRLLRVLALQNTSLTAGELAKRAMLGRSSIYPPLHELERAGVVEFIGAGARKLVQLRGGYPLSQTLKELFRAEARRFDALTTALRELLSGMPRAPISAWIDRGGENLLESTETLTLYVVARPEELDTLTDYLNERLADLERKHDIHIAVHGLMPSELETLHRSPLTTLNAVVLLGGVPPVALLERSRSTSKTSTIVSHDEHNARSRRLAVAIAAKIRRDPGLIAVAEERVRRRAREASPRERRELAEWTRILSTMSPARLQRFLLEDSERAIRLRQTLPALNFLSPVERDAVVRSQTDAEVLAAITHR
jgi:IclR helix-turn-helix domain